MYSLSTAIRSVDELDQLLLDYPIIKSRKKVEYLNIPCVFDIEVSSFYEKVGTDKKGKPIKEKRACMYAWVFGMNGKCIIGRTWDEFISVINKVSEHYGLNINKRLVCYVHNLSYEFQFIRHLFEWNRVFALEQREPVDALTVQGIEFKCSYLLSGYSLAYVGKNLTKYKVEKKVGDLDYKLVRHSTTPLSDKELGYILNDGLVVMSYIQEKIEQDGNISNIPLTKTGYVRKYCRKQCLSSSDKKKRQHNYLQYRMIMNSMQIKSTWEYNQLKKAFQGGFTHANALYSTTLNNDVWSFDEISAYPYAMVSELYPMGSGEIHNVKSLDDFYDSLKYYCCLFDITIYDLESTQTIDHPISYSKIRNIKKVVTDNGRVVSADELTMTITEQDFLVYRKFYKWSKISIKNMIRYHKGYLPTAFVKSILDLYLKKTELKGVVGKEVEYMNSKEQLNSCYGMCVTDICRDEIIYDTVTANGEWMNVQPDLETQLNKYNASKNRILFYPWGVWVTAYARRNRFNAIYEFGNDYCYSDTDSVKGMNPEKHLDWIKKYNDNVYRKLVLAMKHHHLPLDYIQPKTIKGEIKILGQFELDGKYKHFKTFGAKRYLYEEYDGTFKLVVSGLNRQYAIPYLEKKAKKNKSTIFDEFNDHMFIPKEYTGKNIHTYLDECYSGTVIDYLGNKGKYYEESSIHMEGCSYQMGLSSEYIDFLMDIKERVL